MWLIKCSGQTLTRSGEWCSTEFSISKYNYYSLLFLHKNLYLIICLYIKSYTMPSVYTEPRQVYCTLDGILYLGWYIVPWMVHCTLDGTLYLGRYTVPWKVHCTSEGTMYLERYIVPRMVQIHECLTSYSRVTHELLVSDSWVTRELLVSNSWVTRE